MAKPPDRSRPSANTCNLIPPINVMDLKTYPLKKRHSKVRVSDFAKPWRRGGSFSLFYRALPDILAVKTLRAVANAIAHAHRKGRPVIVGIGAHVIKVGLSPVIVNLMEQGIVTAVAMNGAGIIHDFELALMGHTSEEVDAEIDEGRFGMAEETGRILNEAIILGYRNRQGMGEAIGHYINRSKGQFPNRRTSILATGAELGIDVDHPLDEAGHWAFVGQIGAVAYGSSDPDQLTTSAAIAWRPSDDLEFSVTALYGWLAGGDQYGVLFGFSPKFRLW